MARAFSSVQSTWRCLTIRRSNSVPEEEEEAEEDYPLSLNRRRTILLQRSIHDTVLTYPRPRRSSSELSSR